MTVATLAVRVRIVVVAVGTMDDSSAESLTALCAEVCGTMGRPALIIGHPSILVEIEAVVEDKRQDR